MKITHDIIIRVGKEPTAPNEAVQEETGARIVCSSVSANMVRLIWHLHPLPGCNFMPLISAHPGATCHPVSGNCSCTPGYMGPLCERPCQNKTFGEGCQEKCSCPDGYNCDHVTGGCLRYQLKTSILQYKIPQIILGAKRTRGAQPAGRTARAHGKAQLSAPERTVAASVRQTSEATIVRSTVRLASTGTGDFQVSRQGR